MFFPFLNPICGFTFSNSHIYLNVLEILYLTVITLLRNYKLLSLFQIIILMYHKSEFHYFSKEMIFKVKKFKEQ